MAEGTIPCVNLLTTLQSQFICKVQASELLWALREYQSFQTKKLQQQKEFYLELLGIAIYKIQNWTAINQRSKKETEVGTNINKKCYLLQGSKKLFCCKQVLSDGAI